MENMSLIPSAPSGLFAACAIAMCTIPKANISIFLSVIGFITSALFGVMTRAGGSEDILEYVMYGLAIIFAGLCVISYLYRSLEKQINIFAEQNQQLEETKVAFDKENEELKESRRLLDVENEELKETRKLLDVENEELKETHKKLDAENEELAQSVAKINDAKESLSKENRTLAISVKELETESEELKTQVANLNKLHNEGVNMIRQLATYGDSCREFGKDLKNVANDLKHTDDSLGLTAGELDKKVAALGQVIKTLEKSQSSTV